MVENEFVDPSLLMLRSIFTNNLVFTIFNTYFKCYLIYKSLTDTESHPRQYNQESQIPSFKKNTVKELVVLLKVLCNPCERTTIFSE